MLDRLIRLSLEHRFVVLVMAALLLGYGALELATRPVDIFPDLNQPIVTVIAESHGLAPQEVETLVTLPLESALAGAPGVERIRSSSKEGLSLVRVEFGWDTDLFRDRQLVQERLQLAREDLPEHVVPEMAPISSITGEILDIGLVSPSGQVSIMELRTLAEWVVRRRLLSVPGVAQVVIIGGENKQYQVLADPDLLLSHQISLNQLAEALRNASRNTSGGYLVEGSRELLVRTLGRFRSKSDIQNLVVSAGQGRVVRVRDVARVVIRAEFARGTAAIEDNKGVILILFKQPSADTLKLTSAIEQELQDIQASLPEGVEVKSDLFRQATFLSRGVDNVIEALRDGSILVVVCLILFLANVRASLITLMALPLSFASAGVLFSLFDLSLNTMTLGGLAIAVGELVDDAIVGVENIVRRLRQSKSPKADPHWLMCRIADASSEVRGPIFSGTLVVVLVFVPLFALSGLEGRLFSPLALSYVVALLASMIISLTVTPALALYLLRPGLGQTLGQDPEKHKRIQPTLRVLQWLSGKLIFFGIRFRHWVVGSTLALIGLGVWGAFLLGSQFLPDFDEGTVLVMLNLPPGTSLAESSRIAAEAQNRVKDMAGVVSVARYTGRGEHDEHAPPVGISHILLSIAEDSGFSRADLLEEIRGRLADLKGVNLSVGQPLAHRIDHLLSGVQAQIAIKVNGPDLDVLRPAAQRVVKAARQVEGVTDLWMERQVLVAQLHIDLNRERLTEVGLSPGELAEQLEMAIGGEVVGHVLEGERSFDLFLRLDESARSSKLQLRQLPIRLPRGSHARLGELARIYEDLGPNQISRDNQTRRIAISCNTSGRSVGEVVADLRKAIKPIDQAMPAGTSIKLEGQFASQESATRLIVLLSLLSLLAMILILYAQFRSLNLALQVLVCIPVGFLGGLAFLLFTEQNFSIAALVGFVSLAGITTRNGILLVSHYLYLMRQNKKPISIELVIHAGSERAAPVVMTALTTGLGLLPLLLSAGETGREILYPVATVVIGGLITSTLFEFLLRPALFWMLGRKAATEVTRGAFEYCEGDFEDD